MSETPSPTSWTGTASALASTHGFAEAVLAGALLSAIDACEALVSIKEPVSGRYAYANARMAALFGHTPSTLIGLTDADLMPPAQAGAIRTAEKNLIADGTATLAEFRLERDGRKREFSVARTVLPGSGDAPTQVLAIWSELTEVRDKALQLKQALVQLEQRQISEEVVRRESPDSALRDAATGLYQKPHFDDQLRREVDLSSREHREFALVWIALDPFSEATRSFGDAAAARILEALGQLLRGNTRAMDASCRLDEERFAVLLSGVGLATAHSRMEGLRRQCATQIVVLDGRDFGFTVSMGVASFPHTAHTDSELMQAAQLALVEAKGVAATMWRWPASASSWGPLDTYWADGDWRDVNRRKTNCSAAQRSTACSAASAAFHSSGVTGVTDKRLPRRRIRRLASAGVCRICISASNGVLRTSRTSTCTQRGASTEAVGSW